MNPNNLPPGNGAPPAPKVGALSKHAIIDIALGVLSITMAIPGLYLFLERGEWKEEGKAKTALLVQATNAVEYYRANIAQNYRHINAMAVAVQQFLTNEHVAELEIAPTRVSVYRTNLVFKPEWVWQVTPTNIVARKVQDTNYVAKLEKP